MNRPFHEVLKMIEPLHEGQLQKQVVIHPRIEHQTDLVPFQLQIGHQVFNAQRFDASVVE